MSDQDLTVSALLARLAAVLAAADLDEIVVRGQLVGWRRRPAWASAEIVEHSPDGRRPLARIPIGMPGRHAAALEQQLLRRDGRTLDDGLTVTAVGHLACHALYQPVRLELSWLTVDEDPSITAAARQRALDDLLDAGLRDHQSTLTLPTPIHRVGLIAGATTAGRADFHARTAAAGLNLELHELAVPIGGPAAPTAIAAALARLAARNLDCICIIRGGGADLTTFDDPGLARAIASSHVPVIVGIGHATDHTLTDDIAHLSLPTPSAVADHLTATATQGQITADRAHLDTQQRRLAHQRTVMAQQAIAERAASETMARRARTAVAVAVICVLVALALLAL